MAERLGRYLLLRALASGGMGDIFLAEHTGLSGFAKRVALKRIRPELARSQSYLELFLNEARVGSFLNHPNIVHIFDIGHTEEALWLVMEYVVGVDLKRVIRRSKLAGHPLPPTCLAAVMVEVLSALEEAHAGGPTRGAPIIHRDLSPENILVSRSGAVKVLDFGLAKWAPGRSTVSSMDGDLIYGKTRYMPPEQLKGSMIDVRADLFSLGVVMHEALTSRLPFGSGSANAVLANILCGPPPGATERFAEPQPALDAIIAKAMRPNADDRYQSAVEMRGALIQYLRDHDVTLPLERLRTLLDGGPLAKVPRSAENADSRVATEIGLAVAKRCGKCGGSFTALFMDGMIVDACTECEGLWLDHGEVGRVLGEGESGPADGEPPTGERARLDEVVGSCPVCRCGLRAFAVPGHAAALEVCPSCHGVWFDAGEIDLLKRSDVVTWFRTLHDSLRAVTRA